MKKKLNIFQNKRIILILLLIIILFVTIIIKKFLIKKPPIKIGFVNTLTGTVSTSTIKMRDVIVLAVEEVNKKGGINGRKIKLIIKDDKFDPDTALKVDQELIDEGVVAIIGHTFSSLCLKVAQLINKNDILMITPTAQSTKLIGLDDNFLRIIVSVDKEVSAGAIAATKIFNAKKMSIVYDMINPGLSLPAIEYFKNEFEKHGGEISTTIPFNSREKFSAPTIVKKIIKSNVDAVYIVANGINTALICQHLKINNSPINIIAHGWAIGDPAFISEGGQSIEGVIGTNHIDINLANKKYLSFEQKFHERFGEEIIGPAFAAYEAINILIEALSKTTNPKKIKETILKIKTFEGIDSKIVFDKYGDPIRSLIVMKIKNGEYVKIDTVVLE